jgi:hypothetical protein
MLAIVGHVYATRVMPAIAGGAADFSYLAFSVIAWPYFITPYYFVLGTAGAIHLGLGLGFAAQALAPAGASAALRRASIALAAAAGVLVCAGVAGILMKSAEADWSQFQEYRGLYDRYLPVMPPASREAGG